MANAPFWLSLCFVPPSARAPALCTRRAASSSSSSAGRPSLGSTDCLYTQWDRGRLSERKMQCWWWLSKSDCLPPAATSLSSFSLVNSVNELLSMNTFWSLFHQIANTLESVEHLYIYKIDRWKNKARKIEFIKQI